VLLAIPQLPLAFGNAVLAVTQENNRQFPDRPVTERGVEISTGLANAWSGAVGGVPVCHGAGGMAEHVKSGARTGGATAMLDVLLVVLALFFSSPVHVFASTLSRIGAGGHPVPCGCRTGALEPRARRGARRALCAAHQAAFTVVM